MPSSKRFLTRLTRTTPTLLAAGQGQTRTDCLSDSWHSPVKSLCISYSTLQILSTISCKKWSPGGKWNIIFVICRKQENETTWAMFLIVFIQDVRFIYFSCIAASSSHMFVCVAAVHYWSDIFHWNDGMLQCNSVHESPAHSNFNLLSQTADINPISWSAAVQPLSHTFWT